MTRSKSKIKHHTALPKKAAEPTDAWPATFAGVSAGAGIGGVAAAMMTGASLATGVIVPVFMAAAGGAVAQYVVKHRARSQG